MMKNTLKIKEHKGLNQKFGYRPNGVANGIPISYFYKTWR